MQVDTDKTGLCSTIASAEKGLEKLIAKNSKFYTIISSEVILVIDTKLASEDLAESIRLIESKALDLPLPIGYWENGNFYSQLNSYQGVVNFENTDI